MKFFFYDFERDGRFGAPDEFVVSVMVSLDSKLYTVGERILEKGQSVNDVYFIMQGDCALFGRYLRKDTNELM